MATSLPRRRATRDHAKDTSAEVVTILCPPERHISTPLWELVEHAKAAVGSTPQSADLFDRVTAAIEATATHDFSAIRGRVKRDFEYFSLAGTGKALPSRLDKSAPTGKALDEREQRFLSDFHSLLKTAHFKVLSAGEWETAQAENFTFNSPVEVNWDALDTKLLSSFWAAGRARERALAAPVSDRILIYHRGVKTVKASGRFVDDKIDLLVDYLLIGPATRAAGAVAKAVTKVRRGGTGGSGSGSGGSEGGGASVDVAMRLQQLASGVSSAPSSNAEAAVAAAEAAGASTEGAARAAKEAEQAAAAEAEAEKIALAHDAAQSVRRVTFRHLMPSVVSVLKSFPKVLTIEEPAYKDVVVLYRMAVPDKQVRKSEKDPEFDYDPARARRNVHVKRFADVPMADAEMIFPDKTIWLKPILLIQLFATIIGGFVAAWAALKSSSSSGEKGGVDEDPAAKAKRSLSVAVAALSLVGGRAAQVYSQAQAARQAVQDAITRRLYDTTMDSQESDVLFLLDEMADQHVKELFLAYFMLLAKNKGLSKEELDGAIERYLERTFGEKVDFALENSLPFLIKDGLVRVASSSSSSSSFSASSPSTVSPDAESAKLIAAPMADALKALSAKWAAGIEPRAPGDGGDAFALLTGAPGAAFTAVGDAAALLLGGVNAGFKAVGKGLGNLGNVVGIGGSTFSSSSSSSAAAAAAAAASGAAAGEKKKKSGGLFKKKARKVA